MPYLYIQTNIDITPEEQRRLLTSASRTIAKALSKSEHYVMVALQPKIPMLFDGTDQPLAFLVLKSLALPTDNTSYLSQQLCSLIEKQLKIPKDRIYIEFMNAQASLWGWNGRTF